MKLNWAKIKLLNINDLREVLNIVGISTKICNKSQKELLTLLHDSDSEYLTGKFKYLVADEKEE